LLILSRCGIFAVTKQTQTTVAGWLTCYDTAWSDPVYIPPRYIRELREFTRRRKQMVRAGVQERNRVQAVLEDANIKIGNVLTDVFGLSGQLMMKRWSRVGQAPQKSPNSPRDRHEKKSHKYKPLLKDTG
jgi:hypothetical protein